MLLNPDEYSSKLVAADEEYRGAARRRRAGGARRDRYAGTGGRGWAKDRIRELQDLRKSSGFDVSDRITVVMSVPAARADWARAHTDLIAGEVLATSFEFGEPDDAVEIGDGGARRDRQA